MNLYLLSSVCIRMIQNLFASLHSGTIGAKHWRLLWNSRLIMRCATKMNFAHLKEIFLKTLPHRKFLKNGTFRSIQSISRQFNQNVERLKLGNSVQTILFLKTIPDFRKKFRNSLLWTAGFGLVGFVSRSFSGIAVVVDDPNEHR